MYNYYMDCTHPTKDDYTKTLMAKTTETKECLIMDDEARVYDLWSE